MPKLVLVRHARPIIDPLVSSERWILSQEGLDAAHRLGLFLQVDCGSRIWSSNEIKASQTAEAIARVVGTDMGIDHRFGEVSRPFAGDEATYRQNAVSYQRVESQEIGSHAPMFCNGSRRRSRNFWELTMENISSWLPMASR